MKTKIAAIIVFLVTASLFANQENLAKACKTALAEKESILAGKKAEIDKFIAKTVEDRVVRGEEMSFLWQLTQDFKKAKTRFDEELNLVYGVRTTGLLDASLDTALSEYLVKYPFHIRDPEGTVRKFFAVYTGKDVTVPNSWYPGPQRRGLITWLLCLVISLIFLGVLGTALRR